MSKRFPFWIMTNFRVRSQSIILLSDKTIADNRANPTGWRVFAKLQISLRIQPFQFSDGLLTDDQRPQQQAFDVSAVGAVRERVIRVAP
ncbi:hypothetical protein D3C77_410520 [compost metagenome]